ncbi:hypothetical protein HOC35_05585 [Candidatus Woesearchaeota archaeon]|jgi:predicted esterase|nr:hypothetical protein [Candidatus Woesearchaeota archaeon]
MKKIVINSIIILFILLVSVSFVSAVCEDTDKNDYLVKGTTYTNNYPNGVDDKCYTFKSGKTYLFDFGCRNGKFVRYQKNCKEIVGGNYECQDGACVVYNNIPVMQNIGDQLVYETESLNFQVSANDQDADDLTYEAKDLPPQATFNENTGKFSLNPGYDYLKHSNYEFTKKFYTKFRAFDGEFYSNWMKVKITVKYTNQNPVLSPIGMKNIEVGETLSFTLQATDADNENHLGFYLYWCPDYDGFADYGGCYHSNEKPYPEGVSFNPYTGEFEWKTTMESSGVKGVKFYAWDLYGGVDEEAVVINVYKTIDPEGCTDPEATNYDEFAMIDDGSCEYDGVLTKHHIDVSFNNQVKDRLYYVYEPGICVNKECPLLFVFHRLGETEQFPINNYEWQETANENGFIVVFPNSLTLTESKPYDVPGKHWDLTPLTFEKTQDTQFVEDMIDEVDAEYDVDKSKVFTTGHSYGGYFSYYINFVLNDKIKAFGTHSAGLIPYDVFGFTVYWPMQPLTAAANGNTPAIIIYSDDDGIAPKEYADALESQMLAKGHSPVEKHEIFGFGHEWDSSHNQEQWDFFMANS